MFTRMKKCGIISFRGMYDQSKNLLFYTNYKRDICHIKLVTG
jgi:hypothetical protein